MRNITLLVTLDTLFDTRYGTVRSLNKSWARQLVNLTTYTERNHNTLSKVISNISDTKVNHRWDNRDMEVLRYSPASKLLMGLKDHVVGGAGLNVGHPESVLLTLVINTHPYDISNVELKALFSGITEVTTIKRILQLNIPLDNITPKILKGNYTQFIIEDFNKWSSANIERLSKTPIPDIRCTAPLILLPGNEEQSEIHSLMYATTVLLAPQLDVDLHPLSMISMIAPPYEWK